MKLVHGTPTSGLFEGERLVPVRREATIRYFLLCHNAINLSIGLDIKWLKACRSYTMWLVLNWVGLRRAELAALKTHDVDLEARIIQVVNSKGHRGRLVQIRPRLAPTLRWSVQDIRPWSRMATGCPAAIWHWLIVPQTPRSALQHWPLWPFCQL